MTGEQATTLAWMRKDTKQWYFKTVSHRHSRAPVPVLHTSSGFNRFKAYCARMHPNDDACCYSTRFRDEASEGDVSTRSPHLEKHKGLTNACEPSELSSDEQGTCAPCKGTDVQLNATRDAQLRPTPLPMEFQAIQVSEDTPHIVEDEELRFRDDQQQLLHWHHRLGHLPFARLKEAAEVGIIPRRLRNVRAPVCTACMYSKATKKPWRTRAPPTGETVPPVTAPGTVVSVDQLESSTPGFIGQLKGWLTRQRYMCATVFVDQYSDLTFVYLQRSTNADETLDAKEAFERYAYQHGVKILHYHADNGRFNENAWIHHLSRQNPQQTQSYSGVGAHHQNGIAEKRIRDLQDCARTMLIHAQRRWPGVINEHLWPYAIRNAADVDNNLPRLKTKQSPLERFSSVAVRPRAKHFHPFGCPSYVLHPRMQDNKKGPKWSERSRVGIYLGNSPRHARSVGLILNLTTGLVSPQYHVSYDDGFETSRKGAAGLLPTSKWQQEAGFTKAMTRETTQEQGEPPAPDIGTIPAIEEKRLPNDTGPPWVDYRRLDKKRKHTHEGSDQQSADQKITSKDGWLLDAPSEAASGMTRTYGGSSAAKENTEENECFSVEDLHPDPAATGIRGSSEASEGAHNATSNGSVNEKNNETPKEGTEPAKLKTRSGRVSKPIELINISAFATETYLDEEHNHGEDHPWRSIQAMAASANPDILYYHEAMKAPDREKFLLAMEEEVRTHSEGKHWKVVPRASVPRNKRVLPSVWAMRRKRRLDTQEVYKWKARLNVHGGKQKYGVDYWETYSPVVQWTTTRLFLILSVLRGWNCRQLDFVAAYPQAPSDVETYMEFPKGISSLGDPATHVLLLLQNIYGKNKAVESGIFL